MSSLLEVSSVSRQVATKSGPLTILKDINLNVAQGESLAIQGASGSGKSTLLGVLAGLDLPQSGSVIVDGIDITQLGEDERAMLRANQVGFVFQSFYLVDDLTALENIALPLELFGAADAKQTAKQWLQNLGLGERRNHRPAQLSGGEQQRVALGRAFAVEPTLLFADEPTANLDNATSERVLDQLFTLQSEHNTTMIIATHDDHLAKRCDRRLCLQAGTLVEG